MAEGGGSTLDPPGRRFTLDPPPLVEGLPFAPLRPLFRTRLFGTFRTDFFRTMFPAETAWLAGLAVLAGLGWAGLGWPSATCHSRVPKLAHFWGDGRLGWHRCASKDYKGHWLVRTICLYFLLARGVLFGVLFGKACFVRRFVRLVFLLAVLFVFGVRRTVFRGLLCIAERLLCSGGCSG